MSRELLLALDLGTTGVRALCVRADGAVAARAYRPVATRFPAPGRVEHDPEALWQASAHVLREALARAGASAREVAGLGLAAQRATALAWDARTGAPLAPALSWQDQRTAARAAGLRAAGIPITTLPSATRFEWLLHHAEPVRAAAAAGRLRLGTPDAWLGFRLGGGDAHVTDPGQASCTGLYDLRRGRWSRPALALFGVEEGQLPALAPTSAVVGETPAVLLGAPVPVAARAGDQQAACFGQGVLRPGEAKLTLGTAAILDVHAGDTLPAAPAGAFPLALWRLADAACAFCVEGNVITAGAAVDWLVAVGLLPDVTALDRVADSVPDAEGACFVPALQGLGTPFVDEEARGLLGGLTRGTTAAHVARAALDGIAQRCVDVLEALPARGPLRVDGGLARSDLLLGRLADLSGRAVLRAAETETTALGAAWLAAIAVGVCDDPAQATARLPTPARFEPALPAAERDAARERWRARVARAKSSFEPGTAPRAAPGPRAS